MKGHVKKRGTKWCFVVELGRDPITGKRKQKWHSGFATRKAAEAELAKALHQMQTGAYVEPSRMTVADALRKWLSEYARPRVSGKTFERYEEIVEKALIPCLGSIQLTKLQPLQIQSVYNQQLASGRRNGKGGLSPQTVLHHHRILSKALSQAVRWNLLAANPAQRVDPPSVSAREVEAIDEARSAWLIDVSQGTRLHLPILLALYTGMRRGEILALRWSDIDLANGYAHISQALEYTRKGGCVFKAPKSRKGRRVVALPRTLVDALQGHRDAQKGHKAILGPDYRENGLVCCVEDGSIWNPPAFDSSYRALLKRRHLTGPRFHVLRHSHASQLLRAGVDPKVISERLGHARTSFTMDQYVHVLPGMEEEAATKIDAAIGIARRDLNSKRPS